MSTHLKMVKASLKPQGNIYFPGAHLSSTLTWIVSALDSAKRAVQQIAFVNYKHKILGGHH
jgi:monoamine oxidase